MDSAEQSKVSLWMIAKETAVMMTSNGPAIWMGKGLIGKAERALVFMVAGFGKITS